MPTYSPIEVPPTFRRLSTGIGKGAKIQTEDGEIAIEELGIGSRIRTLTGELRPIHWIARRPGQQESPSNAAERPDIVRFARSSLAPDLPTLDLFLDSQHNLLVDGAFVKASYLVNNATVAVVRSDLVELYILELAQHDVIIVNGMPLETSLDQHRHEFYQQDYTRWYAEERGAVHPKRYAGYLHREAPQLYQLRYTMMQRSLGLGFYLTNDPDMLLYADDHAITPTRLAPRRYHFDVPVQPAVWRLVSRWTIPPDMDPTIRDSRRLGVALRQITFVAAGASPADVLSFSSTVLDNCDGLYAAEPAWRWTDGAAWLPRSYLRKLQAPFSVIVELADFDHLYIAPHDNGTINADLESTRITK